MWIISISHDKKEEEEKEEILFLLLELRKIPWSGDRRILPEEFNECKCVEGWKDGKRTVRLRRNVKAGKEKEGNDGEKEKEFRSFKSGKLVKSGRKGELGERVKRNWEGEPREDMKMVWSLKWKWHAGDEEKEEINRKRGMTSR